MKLFIVIRAKSTALYVVLLVAALLLVWSWGSAVPVFWGSKMIYFMGHQLDPMAEDLTEQVTRLVEGLNQKPVNAVIDPETKGPLPDISGFEIMIPETVEQIKRAKNGSVVQPIWREIPAEIRLESFLDKAVWQGNPLRNQVALVINVSWGNEYLLEMLDIFTEKQIKASFFLVGKWATKNPDLVKKIHDLGHEFGNHGYSDPHMSKLSAGEIKEEIKKTNQAIFDSTGITPSWFSPPYGEKLQKIYSAAAQVPMQTVLWSLDTVDWKLPGEDKIVERIVNNLHNGAIILMHPTEQTPGALRKIIEAIKQQGYEAVTVGELIDPSYWPKKYAPLWTGN